jgi:hypothetical protein
VREPTTEILWAAVPVCAALFLSAELAGSPSHFLETERTSRIGAGLCKGLAFDGTNFLAALQTGTNGQLSAQMITSTGTLAGPAIDLGCNGSPPVVGFDGTNYLLVWADFANTPTDILGQFISRSGEKVDSPFPIRMDEDASAVGGIDFDGTNYFIVWAANSQTRSVATAIHGQRVSPAGAIIGEMIQISSGGEDRDYPALTFDGSHHFICWQEKVSGTNLWNVVGRSVSPDGALRDSISISEHPAMGLYPLGVSLGTTNLLVAWSREVGPFLNTEYTGYGYNPTNLSYPMIHGRLISHAGGVMGPEFQISRAKWRQTAPAVAFDGINYLVSWIDGRNGHSTDIDVARWNLFAQKVDQAGGLVNAPLRVASLGVHVPGIHLMNFSDALTNYPSNIGPISLFASNQFVMLFYVAIPPEVGVSSDTYDVLLDENYPTPPVLTHFGLSTNGTPVVQIDGDPLHKYSIEASIDFTNWSLVEVNNGPYWRTLTAPATTVSLPTPGAGSSRMFYRAIYGKLGCIENLRRLWQAKSEWALDHDGWSTDTPLASDIFGPGKYLPTEPTCPHGGIYSLWALDRFPSCTLGAADGHTL